MSLAYVLSSLEELSLARITRSAMHAPEFVGRFPYIPYVMCDDNVPSHPDLGDDLRLPALLHLPTLRKLRISDTHLGDPLWAGEAWRERFGSGGFLAEPCALESLELGCSPFESQSANQAFTERILQSLPSSIKSFTLGTALGSSTQSSAPSTPELQLPQLRTLHLSTLVPLSSIGTTLALPQLAQSPVHTIFCRFFPDDGADGCEALTDFLRERGSATFDTKRRASLPHFPSLRRLSVSFSPNRANDVDAGNFGAVDEVDDGEAGMYPLGSPEARMVARERREAAERLRKLCSDLSLEVEIIGEEDEADGDDFPKVAHPLAPHAGDVVQQGVWEDGCTGGIKGQRARAMSA